MGAVIIVDALWGDSGKGKVCAHLARRDNVQLAVRAGIGTNAGASVTLDDGTHIRARQLPTGWLNPSTNVAVGPGVLIDPTVFADEVERFGLAGKVFADGRSGIIAPEHVTLDRTDPHLVETVRTTGSGTGPARADLVLRKAQQAKDVPALGEYLTDVPRLVNETASTGTVLVEGSQGTMLSLSLSSDYPFTTSGNCTSAAAMDDVGLSWQRVDDVVMVVKALPTRSGAGPLPFELSTDEVAERAVVEYGVVTGRQRRKAAGIAWELLEYAAMLNGPTQIALTFCDHVDPAVRGVRAFDEISEPVRELIRRVEEVTKAPVTLLDTGPRLGDLIDVPVLAQS
ncbi:adenylosuccinate synthetase [Tenggerimyces flavus]|uniref:Adenylosuccinate synthetase n=1 Tax=Tenggerimyces flavus TaxID=1708749 RepID=A0ABV7YN32_9ACTN|nr:adenylosuccinate synthetase [Tenggerimyces flavus]MBM7785751.1 adenylosuccinate synthase [Tenggerimyces flavus]